MENLEWFKNAINIAKACDDNHLEYDLVYYSSKKCINSLIIYAGKWGGSNSIIFGSTTKIEHFRITFADFMNRRKKEKCGDNDVDLPTQNRLL